MLLDVCFSRILPGRYKGDDARPQPIVARCCRMLNATAGRFLMSAFSAHAGTCITSGSNNPPTLVVEASRGLIIIS